MKVVMRDGTGTRNYKYIVEDRDRHGNVRVYLRRPDQKVRLRETVGTPEFDAEYRTALVANPKTKDKRGRLPASKGSFRWLVEHYYRSSDFLQLDAKETQKPRRAQLDSLCEKYGHFPFADMKTRNVRSLRDEKMETPAAANNLLKSLSQLFKWAIKAGHIENSPVRDVENLNTNSPGGIHAWTIEEVEKYEAHHPVGTTARLALNIMLLAGGPRCSDAHRLGPQHMTKATENAPNGGLRYKQHKARNKREVVVEIPILTELKEILNASPGGDMAFIVSETGRPFASSASYGNRVKKWCKEAGLPHCSAHGLRKASACKLAELGMTDIEIMAFNGWTSLRQVQNYTRNMRRKLIAENAAKKFNAGQKLNESVPLSDGGVESGTKKAEKA